MPINVFATKIDTFRLLSWSIGLVVAALMLVLLSAFPVKANDTLQLPPDIELCPLIEMCEITADGMWECHGVCPEQPKCMAPDVCRLRGDGTVQCESGCPVFSPQPTPTPSPATTDENQEKFSGGNSDTPQVLGTTTKSSSVKKVAPGDIQNKLVPIVVERVFKEVYARKITMPESTYWKMRARSDKSTITKLQGAMQWHHTRHSTPSLFKTR